MKGLNKFGNDDKANASTFVLIIVIALNLIGGVEGMLHPLKYAEPETLFPVLFESKRVLVVRKPHGIGHHDESSSFAAFDNKDQRHEALSTPGVLRLLRSERQRQRDEEGERLYGVHRLDKVTSGILVLAKDTLTASTLSEYFTKGKIQKVYFGMSAKKPQKKKQGLVQGGMTRSRNKSWKLLRKPKHGEKPQRNFAKTRFFTTGIQANQIIDQGGDVINAMSKVKTVAMFRPYTGRTHQLRVAAKAMGIPLLGDPIYKDGGGDKNNTGEDIELAATRTMLHASGIHIPKFLDQAEINVWCSPTFFHDVQSMDQALDCSNISSKKMASLADSLDVAVSKLMTKNCDVPGIFEAMMTQQSKKKQH